MKLSYCCEAKIVRHSITKLVLCTKCGTACKCFDKGKQQED